MPQQGTGLLGLPHRVTAVYWTSWNARIPVTAVPTSYNTIYLFHAERGAPAGTVLWTSPTPTPAELDTVRTRGQRVVLSAGGADNGISFGSRSVSRRFVDSVRAVNESFGGTLAEPKIDGVDFNTFEADATLTTSEYLWMFAELKRLFGPHFLVTSPPAPWNRSDQAMVKVALAEGLMDYAAPQYYDGPGLADPAYIIESVRTWVDDVAGGRADRILVGFGMADLPDFSTPAQIRAAWETIEARHPAIRGAFLWQHRTDADRAWVHARTMNRRIVR